tara:strand:- start:1664 stop:1918 length:255 start_codon:yes stop_codon:yes gene_type:complete
LSFRDTTTKQFSIVFENSDSGNGETGIDGNFAEKWMWFGVFHRLCSQDISKLETITKLNLLECLTWLSYETDLNLQNKVQRNDK